MPLRHFLLPLLIHANADFSFMLNKCSDSNKTVQIANEECV